MNLHVKASGVHGSFVYDFSFESSAGVSVLFGASGAGKSTLAGVLGGHIHPQSGHVLLNERTLYDEAGGVFVPPSRRRVGTVFQDSLLFPHLSVKHNLTFSRWAGLRAGGLGFDDVVDLLGLSALLARRPANLSGGERARVALGRALLSNPSLLLLDEPLANLDAPRRAEILPFLQRVVRDVQVPMVYITHSVDEVMQLADQLVLIKAGRVADYGSLSEMLPRAALPDVQGRAMPRSVLTLDAVGASDEHGCALCTLGGQEIYLPFPAGEPTSGLAKGQLVVSAQDVALSLSSLVSTSHQCSLHCHIEKVRHCETGMDVHMRVGGQVLVARVTVRAYEKLGLVIGMGVYAHMKAVVFGGL